MRTQNLPQPLMSAFTEKVDVLFGDGRSHGKPSMKPTNGKSME
jgi:hypothetical protein